MIGNILKKAVASLIICLFCQSATAQFFYEGRGSAKLKWMQLKARDYKLLYPDYYEQTAIQFSGYMDSIMPYVKYGMKKPILHLPIVLETQSQLSNGLVVWAPKREELVTTAPANTYAQPWLKQLAVHEFRHVTQMSNLKGGLTKIATWLFGEAGIGLGLLAISDWELEGDATNAETQLAEYGRGLQPEFTIGYRAMMNETDFNKYTLDQLICGSHKNYFPNIYQYGYQIVRATETYTRPDIWGDIYKYSGQYPILIMPDDVYLKRNYKTTTSKIAKRAFKEMAMLWKPFSKVENNYNTFTKHKRSYTTYQTPIVLEDERIIAQKKDFDTPNYLIVIDTNGVEKKIVQLGNVSSRPVFWKGVLLWTEFKSDLIYEKKNFSVIRSVELKYKGDGELIKNNPNSLRRGESNYFVTGVKDGFATVKYDSLSNGYIQFYDDGFNVTRSYHFNIPTTLHGLAWDEVNEKIAFIALDEQGMWLGALKDGKVEVLKKHSVVTISELRSENGKLYYGSIESGKDEIHCYDVASGVEIRLTSSKYGAIQGAASRENLYMATYSSKGWLLGREKFDNLNKDTVHWSRLPQNILNPNWVNWKIDKQHVDSFKMADTTTSYQIKRYRKAGRQFNFHSWAPIATDLKGLLGEREIKLGFGASGFFQSTLGDMYGSVSLGSVFGNSFGRFWGLADFVYAGLPIKLAVRTEYGGGDQLIYGYDGVAPREVKDFFSIQGELFAPLRFNSGATFRTLTPRFSVTHYNAKLFNDNTKEYTKGYQKWNASLSWSVSKITSARSIKPRLGYVLLLGASSAFNKDFSTQYTGLVRGYLPGILPNHSITLNASYQTQEKAKYNFTGKTLPVRGFINNFAAKEYLAATFDYTFPLCYPDWGIPGAVYFKRISMNLFADYSRGHYFNVNKGLSKMSACSAGFDVNVNFSLLRSFEQEISFSFAFPKNQLLFFSIGYNLNF